MIRRWIVTLSYLVIIATVVSPAFAQSNSRRGSLADQILEIRNDWFKKPATKQAPQTRAAQPRGIAPQARTAQRANQPRPISQTYGRSTSQQASSRRGVPRPQSSSRTQSQPNRQPVKVALIPNRSGRSLGTQTLNFDLSPDAIVGDDLTGPQIYNSNRTNRRSVGGRPSPPVRYGTTDTAAKKLRQELLAQPTAPAGSLADAVIASDRANGFPADAPVIEAFEATATDAPDHRITFPARNPSIIISDNSPEQGFDIGLGAAPQAAPEIDLTPVQLPPVTTPAMPKAIAPVEMPIENLVENPILAENPVASFANTPIQEKTFEPEVPSFIQEPSEASASAKEAFEAEAQEPQMFNTPLEEPADNQLQDVFEKQPLRQGHREVTDPWNTKDVLISNQMPVLISKVSGPKTILIGRQATYRVWLRNTGQVTADGVVVNVSVPAWADLIDVTTSNGVVQRSNENDTAGQLRWHMDTIKENETQHLDLVLIPRTSQPLELGVNWSHAPVASTAIVEVQEPKIKMHVAGPEEVLYGRPQIYRLTLSNPGTGRTENINISLLPPGGGEESVSSHAMGALEPGESKTVEVELTARQAGKLFVKATATAAGDLTSSAQQEVFCRKPELVVDWRGPDQKYTGTDATYFIRVRNPGTALAQGVTVKVQLAAGMIFHTASKGQIYNKEEHTLSWKIGALQPGDDFYMELKAQVNAAGENMLSIVATTADGELNVTKEAKTMVIALADLKLEISDPKGPISMDKIAVYEIRIRNRGSNTAEGVQVVALFSEGIEPKSVEGAESEIRDGRVAFQTIDHLPAGREVVFRIRAKAFKPGTHVFRTEVSCKDLDIKLAAEETTRFYQEKKINKTIQTADHDRFNAFK